MTIMLNDNPTAVNISKTFYINNDAQATKNINQERIKAIRASCSNCVNKKCF